MGEEQDSTKDFEFGEGLGGEVVPSTEVDINLEQLKPPVGEMAVTAFFERGQRRKQRTREAKAQAKASASRTKTTEDSLKGSKDSTPEE